MITTQDRPGLASKPQNAAPGKADGPIAGSDAVFAVGLCLIAAPCLIFLISFMRPGIGWPLAAALALLLLRLVAGERWRFPLRLVIPAAVLALATVLLVGIPQGHSCGDWTKHWALLNEIAGHPWPVSLILHGQQVYLRFYLACYLCPAQMHKAFPLLPLVAAVTAWFFAGYMVVFWSIGAAFRRRPWWAAGLGMFLAAMLAGGDAYVRQFAGVMSHHPLHGWLGYHYPIWPGLWGWPYQFDPMIANLAWVPHQSLGAFIAAAIILFDRGRFGLARAIAAFGLLSLWTPYGMMGLLPVIAFRCWRERRALAGLYPIAAAALGGVFALLIASYLSTGLTQSVVHFDLRSISLTEIGFVPVFLVVELAAFLLILRRRMFLEPYCAVAVAVLAVVPFLHGNTFDFVARASMGPLFILAVYSADSLLDFGLVRRKLASVALALAICLPTSVSEIFYQAEKGAVYHTADGSKLPEAKVYGEFSDGHTITAAQLFDSCGWEFEWQYFTPVKPRIIAAGAKGAAAP